MRGAIAAIAAGLMLAACGEDDVTLTTDTVGCMAADTYSVLLHEAGSVQRLNQQRGNLPDLCTIFRAGETIHAFRALRSAAPSLRLVYRDTGSLAGFTYWVNLEN